MNDFSLFPLHGGGLNFKLSYAKLRNSGGGLQKSKNNVKFIGITGSDIEGLEYIKKFNPAGIILDLELHKGTGNDTSFALLETISKMKFAKKPKIVVTTIVSSESVYNYLHIQVFHNKFLQC